MDKITRNYLKVLLIKKVTKIRLQEKGDPSLVVLFVGEKWRNSLIAKDECPFVGVYNGTYDIKELLEK